MNFFKVAVNTPFNNSELTYSSDDTWKRGDLVLVPLSKRKTLGCILENCSPPPDVKNIKSIDSSYEELSSLHEDHLDFLQWVASYYQYPLGQHIADILPRSLKRPRDILVETGEGEDLPYSLTSEQVEATNKIKAALGRFERFLLHGVTGSGKTTIYLETFREVAKKGQSGLFLIPEINLTPQFIETFKKHLKMKVLTYHSSISNSEKLKVFEEVQKDEPYILIGVRSSIFLPFKNLGVLVLDEEHDGSFKQEDRCPYHTRDIGIKLASMRGFPIILGSATPTLESLRALKNTESYIRLKKRPKEIAMPIIEVIDARTPNEKKGQEDNLWPFTEQAIKELKEKLEANEQALVFVNRLGFASYVQCRSCGRDFHCLNCSTSLKYFKKTHSLNCQFCDFKMPYPESCPDCGNLKLLQKGFGTEKLAEVLREVFPDRKIGRFDRDAVKTFNELKDVLKDFEEQKIDILVGTQMLSKGHNFKKVNLVVLLGIDGQLNFPDFRSNEKAYQLIMQTAGRPGRTSTQGKVLIQSLYPENKIFDYIKDYNDEEFFDEEITIRESLTYPPFSRMTAIYINSRFQEKAINECQKAAGILQSLINQHFSEVDLLGPRPGIIEKRANNFTWTILLRSQDIGQLHQLVSNFKRHFKLISGVSLKVDVDPQTLS